MLHIFVLVLYVVTRDISHCIQAVHVAAKLVYKQVTLYNTARLMGP